MVYESKLPYGLRKDGEVSKLLHISEIMPQESGLKCRCVCPHCGERLLARLPKTKMDFTSRFAHHNAAACPHATETAIHMKAKEIIEEAKQLVLPQVTAEYKDVTEKISSEKNIRFDRVVLERRIDNIIPDIIAYKGDKPLLIEIKITHGIDSNKLVKIRKLNISTLEIDLSNMRTNFDPASLYNEIIFSTANKYWIYNVPQEKGKKKLEEQEMERLNKERRLRQETEREKRHIEKNNEIKRRIREKKVEKFKSVSYQEYLREEWSKEFYKDSHWEKKVQKMGITFQNIPSYINMKISGDIVFGCDRRVWQSHIFSNYIYNKAKTYNKRGCIVRVSKVEENAKNEFAGRFITELINQNVSTDSKTLNHVTELTIVIYRYLKQLERSGYLLEIHSGDRFDAEFVVLDPSALREMKLIPKTLPEYTIIEDLVRTRRWEDCMLFIQSLLIKYSEIDCDKYYDDLVRLFRRITLNSKYKSKK